MLLNRWQRLTASWPRETRDTLFLLGVIGWVLLLQAFYIPWWCSGLAAGLLVWRGWLAWHQRSLPGWPWRLALLLLVVGGTWGSHRTLIGQDAGVTLIVMLLALKTLELRARRDALVVFYLGFFTLLTHFIHSQSLLTALGIVLALWGLLTALVNAHMPLGRPSVWHTARLAGGMAVLGAPIMVALFLLFPRLAPLWALPDPNTVGRSGLSDQMQVGQVAKLALDDSIAFRVDFDGPPPPQNTLYFRGPVLTLFDGRQWTMENISRDQPPSAVTVQGPGLGYRLTLEPHQHHWLLALDATSAPLQLDNGAAHQGPNLQWFSVRPVMDVLRYSGRAHTAYQLGPLTADASLTPALALPTGYNPRTLALAHTLRLQVGADPNALLQAALQHLRTGGYRYTLEPGVYGRDTADEFWFDRKAGFCEHIASSFALLMRASGVPARIVTGYQGGQFNAVGGFWTVRQRDAHAWTEVWLTQRGWVRVDPTAYVEPSRTSGLERLRPELGLMAATLVRFNPTLLAHLQNLWDATNNDWNQWVLNYTQKRQFDLIKHLGLPSANSAEVWSLLLGVLGLGALCAALVAWWLGRSREPWHGLLQQARLRLSAAGLPVPAQATPRQLHALLRASAWADDTPALQQWLLDLEAARYDPVSPQTPRALTIRLKTLTWPRSASRTFSP